MMLLPGWLQPRELVRQTEVTHVEVGSFCLTFSLSVGAMHLVNYELPSDSRLHHMVVARAPGASHRLGNLIWL